ncbi:hypothetical protein H7R52_11875 [Weissella confusa]|uniref:Uncharacterized protein n=1 Tax=Weissella confusa TaxID=1583 RepID=A0A923NIF1_WEICO|nr:hypothetical protein [Weissella confusa]
MLYGNNATASQQTLNLDSSNGNRTRLGGSNTGRDLIHDMIVSDDAKRSNALKMEQAGVGSEWIHSNVTGPDEPTADNQNNSNDSNGSNGVTTSPVATPDGAQTDSVTNGTLGLVSAGVNPIARAAVFGNQKQDTQPADALQKQDTQPADALQKPDYGAVPAPSTPDHGQQTIDGNTEGGRPDTGYIAAPSISGDGDGQRPSGPEEPIIPKPDVPTEDITMWPIDAPDFSDWDTLPAFALQTPDTLPADPLQKQDTQPADALPINGQAFDGYLTFKDSRLANVGSTARVAVKFNSVYSIQFQIFYEVSANPSHSETWYGSSGTNFTIALTDNTHTEMANLGNGYTVTWHTPLYTESREALDKKISQPDVRLEIIREAGFTINNRPAMDWHPVQSYILFINHLYTFC